MMRGFATFWGKHRIIAASGSNIILSEAKNIISPYEVIALYRRMLIKNNYFCFAFS
jgi:hypothetical protein